MVVTHKFTVLAPMGTASQPANPAAGEEEVEEVKDDVSQLTYDPEGPGTLL